MGDRYWILHGWKRKKQSSNKKKIKPKQSAKFSIISPFTVHRQCIISQRRQSQEAPNNYQVTIILSTAATIPILLQQCTW